jgi:hypothetical protein
MAITKSNKHKLSLDQDKPSEKGGCTLATPYALMRSLILDSQISITPLGSCSPLHSKGVSQLNKWVRELNWTSRRCIYTPHFKTYPLRSNSAFFVMTNAPVSSQWLQYVRLSDLTVRVIRHRAESGPSWLDESGPQISSLDAYWCWPDSASQASGPYLSSVRSYIEPRPCCYSST